MNGIKQYKESEYDVINSALRDHKYLKDIEQPIRGYIEDIDRMMVKGDKPIRLWRAIRGIKDIIQESGVIVHRNYSSASTKMEVSKKFTSEYCCILTFLLPPEIKRYDYNDPKYESEILIQRGLQYNIKREFSEIGGYAVYEAEVVLYKEPDPVKPMKLSIVEEKEIDILALASRWFDEIIETSEIFGNTPSLDDVQDLLEEKKAIIEKFPKEVVEKIKSLLEERLR